MEVQKNNYFDRLPTILKRISNAHFIAFDLELSGIPERGNRSQRQGKPTLQERYTEVKGAAEKYQVLQVGLTIVEEDAENSRYAIRPFNFNLSPLIDNERDVFVERDFSYSSSAVNFLIGQGYEMSRPFNTGVPYLTRKEGAQAWDRAKARYDRAAIPDIVIPASDVQATEFVSRVKREVTSWYTAKKTTDSLIITGQQSDGSERPLNRFEKRLVHQTVRSHFPTFETFSQLDSVKVKTKGLESASPGQEPWRRQTGAAICAQTGFRWMTEAIAAGDLSDLDPSLCGRHITGEGEPPSRALFKGRMQELIKACIQRPKVLVGHNCFLDVVYIYKLFYGDLPDRVEDFLEAVHATFPLILDTKFMVTDGLQGQRFRGSPLSEVDQAFSRHEAPNVYLTVDHPQYADDESSFHEAGFDSYVTAKVFLRLAAHLQAMAEAEGKEALLQQTTQTPMSPKKQREIRSEENAKPSDTVVSHEGKEPAARSEEGKVTNPNKVRGSYASSNTFDTLSDSDMEAASDLVETPASTSSTTNPGSEESSREGAENLLVEGAEGQEAAETDHAHVSESTVIIPRWEDDFWRPYSNKMRVFGTQEEVAEFKTQEKVAEAKPRAIGDAGREVSAEEPEPSSSLLQRV